MKKQEKQKQKIKEVLLKILHIVSYVLSLAFIGLCILTGVQSCKPNVQANKIHRDYTSENIRANSLYDSFAYTYVSKYSGTSTEVSLNVQNDLLTSISEYSTDTSYSSDFLGDYYRYFLRDIEGLYAYDTSNEEFVSIKTLSIWYDLYAQNNDAVVNNLWSFRLYAIYFEFGDHGFGYCVKNNTDQYVNGYLDLRYDFDTYWASYNIYNKLYCSTSQRDNAFFRLFFNESTIGSDSSLVFNNQINYNAPLGRTLDSPIVPYGSASGEFYFVDYDFYFISGGQFFNRIRLAYQNANATAYIENTGSNPTPKVYTGVGAYTFAFMTYDNTLSNKSISVNARDQVQYSPSSTSTGWYYANSSTWTSQVYKVVNILDISDDTLLNLTKLNNNVYGNSDIINNNVYLGGIFDLLRMAFGSLTGLMSISVLPGLSLGLFIFLPLVVTIIVLIFKAVRK